MLLRVLRERLVPYRTNILALVGLMDRMLKTRTRFVPNDKAK